MMQLKVIRNPTKDGATLGSLYVDGMFFCFTLEDPVREVKGQPVSQWKIQNDTAIPVGTYDVTVTPSVRFRKDMPLVNNVPGYTGVRIHSGNTSADTDGCLLLGFAKTLNTVLRSLDAFNALFPKIQAALAAGQKVSLTVV
jgi:hypothetical protein